MCVLTSTISHCGPVVPGVSKMWIARRELAKTFLYPNVSRTGLSQVSEVTNNGAAVPWYEFYCEINNTFEEQLSRTDQGGVFPQSLSCIFPKMDTDKRITFEQLTNDRVAVVVETRSSGYWLLGQEFGLKVSSYLASPGTRNGANAYKATFTSVGREQFRKISPDFLSNVAVNGGSNPSATAVLNVGGTGPGGTVTDLLSTWSTTPIFKFGAQPLQEIIQ